MGIEDFLKRPATKQDLIILGIAMWLTESGQGEKGIEAIQSKVRGLLGAAKHDEPKPEAAKESA
jgi:hypothetical protein